MKRRNKILVLEDFNYFCPRVTDREVITALNKCCRDRYGCDVYTYCLLSPRNPVLVLGFKNNDNIRYILCDVCYERETCYTVKQLYEV